LKEAFSELTKRHDDIIKLGSALQIANDAIIQVNRDSASKPERMALEGWRQGLQQAIASFARDEKRLAGKKCFRGVEYGYRETG
jgi:hypothetical protein